jgi:hypothetical protein
LKLLEPLFLLLPLGPKGFLDGINLLVEVVLLLLENLVDCLILCLEDFNLALERLNLPSYLMRCTAAPPS